LRCGIAGLGLIGQAHAAALGTARGAELVLCADVDPAAARRCPPGVRLTADAAELAGAGLDAVVIATPEVAHREIAVACLEAGVAVLCEKPLASSLEDADAIVEAAARSGTFLAVAHTVRFDPRYRALRERVAHDELGPLLSLSARRAMAAPEGRIYAGRTTLALCLGVHDLDAIRWIAGEIVRVHAEAGPSLLHHGSADALAATLRLASGAVATLELSWALPERAGVEWDTTLVAIGAGSSAYLELRGGQGADLMPEMSYIGDVGGIPTGVLRAQDEHFIRAVRDPSGWPGGTPADARRAVELALALDRSAQTGSPLDV
jgi:predicted dehydrogenase